MRLCVFLTFICMLLPAVCGLKCYTCWGANPGECNQIWDCAHHYDRCASSFVAENMVTKECMRSDMCDRTYNLGIRCCAHDLCNGAKHAGIFVPLLLVPFIIISVFI